MKDTSDLLEEAAAELGFVVAATPGAPCPRVPRPLVLESSDCAHRLCWPPRGAVHKSRIPSLISGLDSLRFVETRDLREVSGPPWIPCCLKPDDGSLGEGFVAVCSYEGWELALGRIQDTRPYVVQPLLSGVEYRVTACWDGQYAVARLGGRRGSWSLWADATAEFHREWIRDLVAIVRRLDAPGLGFDVLVSSRGAHVLDANMAPNLAIHVATELPRNVPRAFLESWILMCDARRTTRPSRRAEVV